MPTLSPRFSQYSNHPSGSSPRSTFSHFVPPADFTTRPAVGFHDVISSPHHPAIRAAGALVDPRPVRQIAEPAAVEPSDRDERARVLRRDRVARHALDAHERHRALLLAVREAHREVGVAARTVHLRHLVRAHEHAALRLVALRVLHVEAVLDVLGERDALHVLQLSLDVQHEEHHRGASRGEGPRAVRETSARRSADEALMNRRHETRRAFSEGLSCRRATWLPARSPPGRHFRLPPRRRRAARFRRCP